MISRGGFPPRCLNYNIPRNKCQGGENVEVLSIIADVMLAAVYIVGIVLIIKEGRRK